MTARNLFAEISEGFEALRHARQEKEVLRQTIRLTPEEQTAFVTALLNPPPIAERLRQAVKQYAQPVDVEVRMPVSPHSDK